MLRMESLLSIYLHIPFCRQRCAYCDFFSTAGKLDLLPGYVDSLVQEVCFAADSREGARPKPVEDMEYRVQSVYFGGGTPSLLTPSQTGKILAGIRRSFLLDPDAEFTLEANPGTVGRHALDGFLSAGINRLSLGVQSVHDEELRILGRIHSFSDAERAYADARIAGFANINLDLIYGLPGQTAQFWERTLRQAVDLGPEHLSLYALTLDRGTTLARAVRRAKIPAPEEDLAAEMYELAEKKLDAAGCRHYEISNWARDMDTGKETGVGARVPGREKPFPAYACRHNLQYWKNLPYLGFGAGAHGCAEGRRYATIRSVEEYIRRIRNGHRRRFPLTPAVSSSRIRSREQEIRETMWLGLRLTEAGMDRAEFRSRYGEDFLQRFTEEVESSVTEGLLEWVDGRERIRLTPRGRLLGNLVFIKFV